MSNGEWSGKDWRITFVGNQVDIALPSDNITARGSEASRLTLRRRRFRFYLYEEGTPLVRLSGIKKSEATLLTAALHRLKEVRVIH